MIDRSLKEALAHLPRVVVFVELCENRSFRATAKRLGLSPSTVTHHIKALEAALGVRLIERTSRSMTLTAAGQTLLEEAGGIVELWKRGSTSARVYADAPVGPLVVTAPDVVAEQFVVPAIRRFTELYDRVQVALRISTDKEDLLANGIDIAVRIGPLKDSNHGVHILDRGFHGIVATPALAAQWPARHPRDLEGAPWVRFGPHPDPLPMVGPKGLTHALKGKHRTQTTAAAGFIGLVSHGLGFGTIPRTLIRDELRDGTLVVVMPEWSLGAANIYAVTPSPRTTDIKVRLFTDILASTFQEASE